MREVAQKINWSEIIKGCDVEDDWVAFKNEIIDIRDKYIPKRSYKVSFKAKWVTKEVTKCRRLKNKAWKCYVNPLTARHFFFTLSFGAGQIFSFLIPGAR